MKWAKSEEFPDFHTAKIWCENVPTSHKGAAGASLAKMGAPSHRLAATDDDGFTIFGSHAQSSNPLIEICLLVLFPSPSTQGVSECTPPVTSLRTHDPGFHLGKR